jgi:DNA-binding NarL/FixJ family response regulator
LARKTVAPTRKPVRVLIADDHAVFREGLVALLNPTADIRVVGEVGRAADLQPALTEHHCDILLLDLKMDRWVMHEIAGLSKQVKVVVLTGSDRDEDVVAAIRLGARAVVLKSFAAETLRDAIRAVADGQLWIPEASRERLARREESGRLKELTPRETEIVGYVAAGLRNAEIAKKLLITEGTVKVHINSIFKKVNIRDRVELALYAISNGLTSIPGSRFG